MNTLAHMLEYLLDFYPQDKLEQLSQKQLAYLYNKSQPQKVTIASLENKPVGEYLVDSLDGFVPVVEWRNKGTKSCVRMITEHSEIVASTDHFFEMSTGKWKYAEFILPGEAVKTQWGNSRVTSVGSVGRHTVYDFHIGHVNHRYFTNGISSHNSGSGKSLFMANLGVNWALAGLNVMYLTFELSEELVSMRIDSMITGIPSRDVFKSVDDVEMKVKMIGKKSGGIQVKYMPSGKTPNDVRSYIKEYEIKTGRKVDVLLIDYLDLLHPNGAKISAENLFIKDKYVSEELRNLAMELNTIFVTASQLNRASVEEIEFDHSHISGGISKINTADNLFGIFTSRAMRERGRYQLQLMKTRSSSGVNSKIDLGFDVDTLRIFDIDEDEDEITNTGASSGSDIVNSIKRKSHSDAGETETDFTDTTAEVDPTTGNAVGKVRAETDSAQLRNFLNNLK